MPGRPLPHDPTPADLLKALRRDRLRIVATTLLGALITLAATATTTPRHTAVMVVGPTSRVGPAGIGPTSPAGPASAPRALSEPGPGEESLSDYARYLQLLTARPVAAQLAADPALLAALFPDHWDAASGTWRPPTAFWKAGLRALRTLVGMTAWAPPDADMLVRYLDERVRVEIVGGTPMRRVSFAHPDRDTAVAVLVALHATADGILRDEAARRTAVEMDHVRARLDRTTTEEHRAALVAMLGERERAAMMLPIGLPFAADRIVPPAAPVLPDWPDPAVLVPFGALVGFATGLVCCFLGVVLRSDAA